MYVVYFAIFRELFFRISLPLFCSYWVCIHNLPNYSSVDMKQLNFWNPDMSEYCLKNRFSELPRQYGLDM